MTESERFVLNDRLHVQKLGGDAYLLEHFELSARFELLFQNEVLDEVGDDAVLAGRRDDDQPLCTGICRFSGDEFDTGSVDDRK